MLRVSFGQRREITSKHDAKGRERRGRQMNMAGMRKERSTCEKGREGDASTRDATYDVIAPRKRFTSMKLSAAQGGQATKSRGSAGPMS